MNILNVVEYFSSTMPEADSKFRAACRKLGGEPIFHRHALTGPNGEHLHVGEFLYGSKKAKKAIIFNSGMHGIEGYAGAGFQVGLMESGLLNKLPMDVAVLFIHMMNPWGCAWDRREDDNNVDVARNFIYGDTPAPANPDYDAISEYLNPTEWTGPVKEQADLGAMRCVERLGAERVSWAIRNGQHNHPKGMTFHGTEPSWSRVMGESIVARHLSSAEQVLAIDLHTGIGGYGDVTVMSYADVDSEIGKRLSSWYGEDQVCITNDPMAPKHQRMPLDALKSVLPKADIFTVAIEFGAEPIVQEDPVTAETFRHLSYLHNYGDLSSKEALNTRARFRAWFYGETDEWRQKAWSNGMAFYNKTVLGLTDWFNQ